MKTVTVDVKPTDTSYKNHCAKNPGTGTGCVTTNHLPDWRGSRLAAKPNIAQADLTTGVSKRSQPTEPPMIYNISSILRKHEHRTLAESNHDASFADDSHTYVWRPFLVIQREVFKVAYVSDWSTMTKRTRDINTFSKHIRICFPRYTFG